MGRRVLIVLAMVAVGIQFIRPARTNPPSNPSATLAARVQTPPEVAAVLDRSCRDCHSNDTRWPWYSNVAPVSWWVIDHVNHGRSHFNFSEWARYDSEAQRNLLREACELARKRAMPLPSYLRMHDAEMNDGDLQVLCEWTERSTASLTPADPRGVPPSDH